MLVARICVDLLMGPWEALDKKAMQRLQKRELAALTPYVRGVDNRHKVSYHEVTIFTKAQKHLCAFS